MERASRVITALVVLAAVVVVLAGCGGSGSSGKVSADRLSSSYVKSLAGRAGVRIIGDKVWAHHRTARYLIVAVRVRFCLTAAAFLGGNPQRLACALPEDVTTIEVKLVRSDYQVAP
jgi:hypothetical protein